MVFPQKEKDFFNNEEYLKQVQTKKDYEIESKRRIKYKQDNEKFYINSVKVSRGLLPYRTKGLSIFRQQLPKFIEALENIQQGVFDPWINKMLLDAGAVKKIPQELVDSETNNMETRKKNNEYDLWFQTLTNAQKKEAKKLEKSGWSANEIITAFKAKSG